MRIARFSSGAEPRFGLVEGPPGGEHLVEIAGDPLYSEITPTGATHELAAVRLLAPVLPRSKVVGLGRNYPEHATELGNEPASSRPVLFLKPNTAVVGPGDPITLPWQSEEVHHEAELAVVVGRLCRDVPPERVDEVVLGYTCANDVTARDLQVGPDGFTHGKVWDSFCPLGPWLTTAQSLTVAGLDVDDLAIAARVDGRTVQDARTSEMIRSVAACVAAVSELMTLLPGDVILTGTPAGVGPIRDGQLVEVEIEGLGVLANPVRDAGAGAPA